MNLPQHIKSNCMVVQVKQKGLYYLLTAKECWHLRCNASIVFEILNCWVPYYWTKRLSHYRGKALSTLSQKVRLSHKSETVAVVLPFSATVSLFCDSLTYLRQCGQGLTDEQTAVRVMGLIGHLISLRPSVAPHQPIPAPQIRWFSSDILRSINLLTYLLTYLVR